MELIDNKLDNIPDIYDLSNFNNNLSHSFKFIFSDNSLNNNTFKEIYINDELISKKYYTIVFNSFNIKLFLKRINHDLYKILSSNNNDNYFDMYIKTNLKKSAIIETSYLDIGILDKLYYEKAEIASIRIYFSGYLDFLSKNKDINYSDDNIYINIYIRKSNNKKNIRNNLINYTWSYDSSILKIPIFDFKNRESHNIYGFALTINHIHKITTLNKKIKSYTIPIENIKNASIILDLYCFDEDNITYYITKIINNNTNEIISTLPDVKCSTCNNLSNIDTAEFVKKENICRHKIILIKNQIEECFNIKKLYITIKFSDIINIAKQINDTINYFNFIKLNFKKIYNY